MKDPRAQTTDQLIAANLALTRSLELDVVLGTLLDHLSHIVPYDTANVMLLEPDGTHFAPRAFRGYDTWSDPEFVSRLRLDAREIPHLRALIDSKQGLLIPDTARHAGWATLAELAYIRSWLGVPLVAAGQVIGLYSVDKAQPDFFTDDHLHLAEALAAQAAVAIQNALLFRRIQAQAVELREGQERYRQLFDSHPHPMWVYDIETLRFLAVNDAAVRYYGYSRAEFLTMTISDIRPSEDVAQLVEAVGRSRGRTVAGHVWRHLKKDGGVLDVEISSHDLVFDGRAARLVLAVDVTQRRQAEQALIESEERLRQSQKMEAVGQLAGGVAHDFNNLLMVITGYSDQILSRLPADDPLRRKVEQIRKAGDRAASLTRQLLAFSRKQVIEPKVLDLNAVVAGIEKMLRRLIGEHIDIVMLPGRELGRVRADPGQIEQVIMNLVVNARDAMPHGGRLGLETANVEVEPGGARAHGGADQGRYVVLTVADNGVGMSRETLSRAFEPFFTTKEQGKGTGLGLATVYGIVKQSGGHIAVESEAGQGTTFRIYLPRVDVEPEIREDVTPATPPGRETLLLVEDDPAVRELVRELLADGGYTVLEARHPGEALEIAGRYRGTIHLLVTDVVMPQMNGAELARRLVQLRPSLAVLYMSGYTDDLIAQQGILREGTILVEKPFTPEALSRKIREALERHGRPGS